MSPRLPRAPAPDAAAAEIACRSKAFAWSISRWAGPARSARARWPISAPTSSRSRPRNIRTGGAASTAARPMFRSRCTRRSVRYCIMNRNKRGITLDLTRPQGLALAKRLLADADLVVDNYSVEVLPKMGLGYDVLSKLNPKLVMMSMSAFGAGSVLSRLPRLWLDAGAGLGPAERGRRSRWPAGHEPYRVRRCRRRPQRLRGGADRADPRQVDRQGPVHRSRADRMHDAVCRALDHRAFDRRQGAGRNTATAIRISCRMAASAAPAPTTGSWSRFPAMRCGRSWRSCSAVPTGPVMRS